MNKQLQDMLDHKTSTLATISFGLVSPMGMVLNGDYKDFLFESMMMFIRPFALDKRRGNFRIENSPTTGAGVHLVVERFEGGLILAAAYCSKNRQAKSLRRHFKRIATAHKKLLETPVPAPPVFVPPPLMPPYQSLPLHTPWSRGALVR